MKRALLSCLLVTATFAPARAGQERGPVPVSRMVMVHGIFQAEWRAFGFLRRDLESRGVECLVPSLKPADARDGLPALARQLKREIDARFGPEERIALVGFSMGGLVSRYYLQELGGAGRCDAFFTISTPHHGTAMARLCYGKGACQMRRGSPWLERLAETEERLGKIPVVSYRTPADLVILPSRSSEWDRAVNISVLCPLHPMMPASPKVRQDILSRLKTPG